MPAWGWALVVIGCVAIVAFVAYRTWRTRNLRSTFGPEYERTVEEQGGRRSAESDLRDRQRRRSSFDVVPLSPQAREGYADQWRTVQQRFVDTPADAVREADVLVVEVMRERGYPMDDFEQRASDISVDHPNVVDHYRKAHATRERSDQEWTS